MRYRTKKLVWEFQCVFRHKQMGTMKNPRPGHLSMLLWTCKQRLCCAWHFLRRLFSGVKSLMVIYRSQMYWRCITFWWQVGEASGDIIRGVGGESDADRAYEDALLALAKAVANATASLVRKAKAVANQATDQTLQNQVITSATQCALATSQLVGCTKVCWCMIVVQWSTHYVSSLVMITGRE